MNKKNVVYIMLAFASTCLFIWIAINFVLPVAVLKINHILGVFRSAGVDMRFLWLSLVAAAVGQIGGRI